MLRMVLIGLFALSFALTACGGDDTPASNNPTSSSTTNTDIHVTGDVSYHLGEGTTARAVRAECNDGVHWNFYFGQNAEDVINVIFYEEPTAGTHTAAIDTPMFEGIAGMVMGKLDDEAVIYGKLEGTINITVSDDVYGGELDLNAYVASTAATATEPNVTAKGTFSDLKLQVQKMDTNCRGG